MTDKFLGVGASGDLTSGTQIIYARTLSAANFIPSKAMKTDSIGIISSSDLSISDVTGLQAELDSGVSPFTRTGTVIAPKVSGDTIGIDTITEHSVGVGVSIEGVVIKDGTVTVTLAPSVDTELANKKYVDDQITSEDFWDRSGTTIQPNTLGDDLAVDIINEQTVGEGVTIEGMLLKDSILHVDTINEDISDAGVTIENILLKDGNILPTVDDTSYLGSATKQFKDAYFTTGSIDYTAGDMNTDIIRLNTSNINLREGASVQDYTTSYATAASVLTYTITDASGTGIIAFFLDGKTLVHVGATMNLDITAYAGTDASPKDIHIYVENDGADNPIMVAGNAHPVSIHSDVAQMKVGLVSATSSTVYSEVSGGIIPDEMLYKMAHRFYHQGSLYVDGCGITATSSDVTIATGNVMQILNERASIQRQVTVDGLFSISSAGVYSTQTNFTFTEYSNGGTIGVNKFHNVVIGILVDGDTKIMALVQDEPISEYNTLLAARNDQYNTLITFPTDSNLNKLFIPICRIILQTGVLQDLGTSDYYINLRGVGQGSTNSSAGGVTDHGNLTGLADDDHTQYFNQTRLSDGTITNIDASGDIATTTFSSSGLSDAAKLSIGSTTTPVRGKIRVHGTTGASSEGPFMEFITTEDAYPCLQIIPQLHDSMSILFDAYSDGTTTRSSSANCNFRLAKTNIDMQFLSDSGVSQGVNLTWNSVFKIHNSGILTSTATRGNSIGTQRDVHIDANSEFGYDASVRSTKINIIDLPNADSLYNLTPVKFNYRKKVDNVWTETSEDETNYGLIADDITDDQLTFREDPPEGENLEDQPILGLKKMSLISLCIKAIQEQKVIIDNQANQIAVLQARDTAIEIRLSALE